MRRVILISLPLLAACSLLRSLAGSSFERPTLAFKELRFPNIDFHGAEMNLVFDVTNPNSVGLDLTKADYNVEVEGHPVVSGKPQKGLLIPAGTTTEVTFPAKFSWSDIAPGLEALFAKDSVRYKAQGELGIDSPIGPISLPLSHEGTFTSPKMPKVDIESPQLTSLTLTGARLALPLRIANPNFFPLPLGGMLGTIEIAGEKVGRVVMPAGPTVPPGKDTVQRIPLDLSFLSTGAAVASAIRSGVAEVKIDGTLNAAGATLPVKVAKTVEIRRDGGAVGQK